MEMECRLRWTPGSQGGTRTTATRGLVEAPASGHRPGVLSLTTFPGCLPPWHLAAAGSRSRTPYVTRGFLPSPPLGSAFRSRFRRTCASPHLANWPPVPVTPHQHPQHAFLVPAGGGHTKRTVLAPPRARAGPPYQRSAANRSDTHRGGPSGTLLSIDQPAALNMHACSSFVCLDY
jgi:hypothetical protein